MSLQTDAVILFVKSIAKQFDSVKKIMLFGSRAKGLSHKTSDYDFCIWWNETGSQSYGLFCEKVRDGSPSIHSIDLVRFDLIGEELRDRVLLEGVSVYEQEQG